MDVTRGVLNVRMIRMDVNKEIRERRRNSGGSVHLGVEIVGRVVGCCGGGVCW